MHDCQFTRLDDGRWHCGDCDYTSRTTADRPPSRTCPTSRTGPPLLVRVHNAADAYGRFASDGGYLLEQDKIDARLAVCQECELFNGKICTHSKCGCPVTRMRTFRNKLALSTESCPIGKWSKASSDS